MINVFSFERFYQTRCIFCVVYEIIGICFLTNARPALGQIKL